MQFQNLVFLCVANSARSQLAEALARRRFGPGVTVQSAGSAPSRVHPMAARVLAEVGIDPASLRSKHVDTLYTDDIDLVVHLCAEAQCPVLLSSAPRLNWSMADPDRPDLSEDAQLQVFRDTRDAIDQRLAVLEALRDGPEPLVPTEFHASVRVPDLAASARFYTWLLGVAPKVWTHRYVTFVSPALRTNFVLLVDDGKVLHQDTLYHLGVELPDRAAVIAAHHRAAAAGFPIHKPARTTWRGTPLHELWLKDPGGNLVEVYARLTDADLTECPDNLEPSFLVTA